MPLFIDGFENSQKSQSLWTVSGSATWDQTPLRGTGKAVELAANAYLQRPNPSNTFWAGFYFKAPASPSATSIIFQAIGAGWYRFNVYTDGKFGVTSDYGGGNTISYARCVNFGAWNSFEAKGTWDGAVAGTAVDVWINGTKVITQSLIDSNGVVGTYRLGSASDIYQFDHFWIDAPIGTLNASQLQRGPFEIERLIPTGSGTSSAWVGSDADSVDNYLLVDDGDKNSADYVTSSTAAQDDTYTHSTTIPATSTVYAVQTTIAASNTVLGEVQTIQSDGTNIAATSVPVSSSMNWVDPSAARTVAPDGSAWTPAKVNSLQFGVRNP